MTILLWTLATIVVGIPWLVGVFILLYLFIEVYLRGDALK